MTKKAEAPNTKNRNQTLVASFDNCSGLDTRLFSSFVIHKREVISHGEQLAASVIFHLPSTFTGRLADVVSCLLPLLRVQSSSENRTFVGRGPESPGDWANRLAKRPNDGKDRDEHATD